MTNKELNKLNAKLSQKAPQDIVKWALSIGKIPVVTTNFRPYEAAILHAVSAVKSDIKVIWCDTGYNTRDTYKHAQQVISQLNLNVQLYVPKQTTAHRDVVLGIPEVNDLNHKLFSEQVKLEPFKRAMKEHKPDVWFTNLRKGQTNFRDSIDILSYAADGALKVSPFYHYDDDALDIYLETNNLQNEFKYFDPTKVLSNRECGIHA